MYNFLSRKVAATTSESHYHFFDNRVLPPHVDSDLANKEGWWYKPEYIINHININSAMFEPRHNSFFPTNWPGAAKTMKVCGYYRRYDDDDDDDDCYYY